VAVAADGYDLIIGLPCQTQEVWWNTVVSRKLPVGCSHLHASAF